MGRLTMVTERLKTNKQTNNNKQMKKTKQKMKTNYRQRVLRQIFFFQVC